MATRPASLSASIPLWILAVIASLMFLRAASGLMIPIALAVLISYALAPVVARLERIGVPKLVGAALVLVALVSLLGLGGYALRDDVREVVERAPEALRRGRQILQEQLGPASKAIEPSGSQPQSDGQDAEGGGSDPTPGSFAQRVAGAVVALAGHLVVILFLIYFLLISADHVKQRIVEIAGPDAAGRRTALTIIEDINTQIQRYLLVLLVTAVIVGLATWGALAWIGVRHALMWGALAGLFNSIPYFGPVIVSGGLFVVGIAQGDAQQGLQMSAVAIVITSLEGWLLTPLLMGKAERMSALAVFLGLLLWTWVWGAWGTVLAVPMLAVLKSIADHVDPLKPIGRLLAANKA